MKKRFFSSLLAAAMLFCQQSALAEDIDLFLGNPPGTAEAPNVLIVLDNTANWNTPFANEKAALVSVFNSLPLDKFRIGLMMFTETGSPNNNIDGGYVRAAIRLMDATNRPLYSDLVNALSNTNPNSDKSNGGKASTNMTEAYYYFKGLPPRSGNNKVKTDYNHSLAAYPASDAVWALAGNALNAFDGSPYNSPYDPDSCAKNFIIYISNGAVQDNASDSATASSLLNTAATNESIAGATTTIPISPSGSMDNMSDEWTRFMKASSMKITTYTIDVNKLTTGQGPGWTALLKSMANVSGGKYFDVNSATNAGQEIADALNDILTEILSVNSVFASVSLPASTNTQSTFLNQVFIGMFRPDEHAFPRWYGNLKQYKLGLINGTVKLVYDPVADSDLNAANDLSAINANTGFITECARSFWTPTSIDNYWSFRSAFFTEQGGCLAVPSSDGSNYPDGKFVEKGAQAYKLRSTTTRTVNTCSPVFASCNALVTFDTSLNTTTYAPALFDAVDATERNTLISWARGLDLPQPSPNPDGLDFDENTNGVTLTEMRPSVHGDVVHSRPVVVNYGTDASPQVVVFYSGNDGMLRAINGNRYTDIGSTAPGMEFWAFMPPEFYANIRRIRNNNVQISYPGSAVGTLPKPYGMDGPLTAYKGLIGADSKVFLYAAMRRGGRALYAFDATTIGSPSLKWKVGCPNQGNDTGCSGAPSHTSDDFTGIGQTWSPPSIIKASGYGSGASPMLIMGGGYDTCEDTDDGTVNHSCTISTKGNKVYVLDANTGELLKAFDTDRSVIAGVTVAADDAGLALYGYTADMGGNIYRINMASGAPSSWTITKIATLGCDTISPCDANRKFMFAPDVVRDGNGNYYLLVGSGDREKPLLGSVATSQVVNNYFFMVRDVPSNSTWLTDEASCGNGTTVLCRDSLTPILTSATPTPDDLALKKGWYLGLASTEQVVTSAITVSNIVTFSTHQPAVPDPASCGNNLGTANVYNINFRNAESAFRTTDGSPVERFAEVSGGGLSPSPVAGKVRLDDGSEVPFIIGGSRESPLEGGTPLGTVSWTQPKSRVYWYIQQ